MKPEVLAQLLMKRVAKFLVGAINYPHQDNSSQIDCNTDADWAGDVMHGVWW